MTLTNDRILDLRDKINSLEFCLINNDTQKSISLESNEVLIYLDIISDRLIKKTSNFKSLLDIANRKNFKNRLELEVTVKNRISICMSLALKIEYLKTKVFETKEIKVSQYVADFIKDV